MQHKSLRQGGTMSLGTETCLGLWERGKGHLRASERAKMHCDRCEKEGRGREGIHCVQQHRACSQRWCEPLLGGTLKDWEASGDLPFRKIPKERREGESWLWRKVEVTVSCIIHSIYIQKYYCRKVGRMGHCSLVEKDAATSYPLSCYLLSLALYFQARK